MKIKAFVSHASLAEVELLLKGQEKEQTVQGTILVLWIVYQLPKSS